MVYFYSGKATLMSRKKREKKIPNLFNKALFEKVGNCFIFKPMYYFKLNKLHSVFVKSVLNFLLFTLKNSLFMVYNL